MDCDRIKFLGKYFWRKKNLKTELEKPKQNVDDLFKSRSHLHLLWCFDCLSCLVVTFEWCIRIVYSVEICWEYLANQRRRRRTRCFCSNLDEEKKRLKFFYSFEILQILTMMHRRLMPKTLWNIKGKSKQRVSYLFSVEMFSFKMDWIDIKKKPNFLLRTQKITSTRLIGDSSLK